MTAEELKDKIQFTQKPHSVDGYIVISGSIKFEHELTCDKQGLAFRDSSIEEIKKHIREKIAQHIYGWQRDEFFKALDEYMSYHHLLGPFEKAEAARERLLKAARYQESHETKIH